MSSELPSLTAGNNTTTSDLANSQEPYTSHVDDSVRSLQERFECPICCNWLNEPMLTDCGHRFCKKCISEWLQTRKQCPIDNKNLSPDRDVFPDNCTKRDIDNIRLNCPNSALGCNVVASPIEMDKHLILCPHNLPSPVQERCPFARVNCPFVASDDGPSIQEHVQKDMEQHMNLLLEAFQNQSLDAWTPPQKGSNGYTASALPPPPAQYANEAENLMTSMYQRIVVLEQRSREQEVRIENLTKQMKTGRDEAFINPRYSNGVIVWEIANFKSLVEKMRQNASTPNYSRECYTSYHGYKFCVRINVYRMEHLSLHVHLMHSENDYHLEWPFKGRLRFCMIHPKDQKLSQCDTIMSKSDLLAFNRPTETISRRGFGYLEYARIDEIFCKGFVENDRLVLKIEVNIV